MDLYKFYSTQRYEASAPLRNLVFSVALSRAPLAEEQQTEVLCTTAVGWDGKVFSPAEKIEMIRLAAAKSGQAGKSGGPTTCGDDNNNNNSVETKGLFFHGQNDGTLSDFSAAAMGLRKAFEKPTAALFTRTREEDYVCEAEEECPVEPRQCPSPLAAMVLRQHHIQQHKNSKMYFMWAFGTVVASGEGVGSVENMRWDGWERVMCIITAEKDGTHFTAKPSINETHALFFDSLYIYSFKITVTVAEETCVEQSDSDVFIQQINKVASCVKGRLFPSCSFRRDALRRMLLQQATVAMKVENLTTENAPMLLSIINNNTSAMPTFKGRARYGIFGTVNRCIGVPEGAICLHCQWQRVRQTEGEDDGEGMGEVFADGFITQLAFAATIIVDDFVPLTLHTFNIPFEYHFDDVDAATTLRLVVTAFSETACNQQATVGYTLLTVPHAQPGRHVLRAPLWRVRKTGREFLRSAFVGGAPSLVDRRDVGGRWEKGLSIKHGLVTEPSGDVEVTVMVLRQQQMS